MSISLSAQPMGMLSCMTRANQVADGIKVPNFVTLSGGLVLGYLAT
jgi:hypothetical protein